MTDADATRLAGGNSDATRLAGESYRTRLAPGTTTASDDKTRLAQEGYQSKLARDAANEQPDAIEFYKVGDKIGDRYEVSAIHHGAMGVVYGCFDHQTKLPRALKTVRSRHLHDKQVLSLFENEATVWVSLEKHPYIVRAYLVDRINKLPYVITEYVCGQEGMEGDLRGWLGHPRLTLPVAVAMALQIAQGMQHAVRKVPNLVHRDLKPANILVNGDGKAMVTDFGLVNTAEFGAGTPAYMSPEQWREDALDARSDIYAYGCILFEMFTGHRLFPALTERDWKNAHLESTPAALTSLAPELPGEIDQYVRRCLEKDAGARPQNWDEVVSFFAEWYHLLTGKAVVLDFSSLALDAGEWYSSGYSLLNLKHYKEALFAFDRALEIDPDLASVRSWATSPSLERIDEMSSDLERMFADRNCAREWCAKGVAHFIAKRYEEAIQDYDCALEIDHNNADAWVNKSNVYFELKHFEPMLSACEHALTINPDLASAWNNKGIALKNLKRHEEAINAYDRAIAIDQMLAVAWQNKGNVLRELWRYEDAIQAYDRALSIDPDDVAAWHNKGIALKNLKRHEEAIYAYDRALAIDPNLAVAWRYKGNALHDLNRYEEAVLAYEQALNFDQNDANTWCNKGNALHYLHRYEEAVMACDKALTIYPGYAIAQNTKSLSLQKLIQREAAPTERQPQSLWKRIFGK